MTATARILRAGRGAGELTNRVGIGPAATALAVLAIFWETIGRLANVDFFPPLTVVLVTLGEMISDGLIISNLATSLTNLVLGFAVSLIIALTIGLLMDEPFGALDEQTRRLLQEELIRIWEATRTTVVFITHSMEEAVLLGDRVVLMRPRPGRIDEVIDIPLSRPRATHLDSVESSGEFVSITARLWERLRGLQTDVRHTRAVHPATGAPPA